MKNYLLKSNYSPRNIPKINYMQLYYFPNSFFVNKSILANNNIVNNSSISNNDCLNNNTTQKKDPSSKAAINSPSDSSLQKQTQHSEKKDGNFGIQTINNFQFSKLSITFFK